MIAEKFRRKERRMNVLCQPTHGGRQKGTFTEEEYGKSPDSTKISERAK